jgi:hypothetical protein
MYGMLLGDLDRTPTRPSALAGEMHGRTYARMVRIDAGVRKSFELTIELHQPIDCGSRFRLRQPEGNFTNDFVAQISPGASLAAEQDERQHREQIAVYMV